MRLAIPWLIAAHDSRDNLAASLGIMPGGKL
jgi:hypothetical protein